MSIIPSGQKFHTVPSSVNTQEKGSALANSQREIYTMQDIIDTAGGGVTDVTATAPLSSTGGSTPAISMPAATNSVDGYLTAADRTTFNSKVSSVSGTSPISSSGGTTPAISIATASAGSSGALSSTDWSTFNNKQATLVSGTNIKTVNGNSLLGGGDLVVSSVVTPHMCYFSTSANNTFTNTVNGAAFTSTGTVAAGVLNLTPFTPKNTFTATAFSVNVTTYSGSLTGGRILIYSGGSGTNMDNSISLVANITCDITAAGIITVMWNFTFVAGVTYWLGWNATINLGGAQTFVTATPAAMVPLTCTSPLSAGAQLIGYNITSFPTGTPSGAINLASFNKTASGCVQIFWRQ